MKDFMFDLGNEVVIVCSGESGQIIGRADYLDGDDMYNIRYKAADGRAVEAWWAESAIVRK